MAQKVKEVIDLLEENGWRCVRVKGSHRKSILREMGLE